MYAISCLPKIWMGHVAIYAYCGYTQPVLTQPVLFVWPAPSTLALPLLTCYSLAPATQVSFSLLPWALCSHWSLCLENSSLWILASLSTCEKGQINSMSLPLLISLMLYFSFFQNTPHSFNPWFASSYLLCISLHHNPSHTSTGSFVLFLQLLRIVHSRH